MPPKLSIISHGCKRVATLKASDESTRANTMGYTAARSCPADSSREVRSLRMAVGTSL